MREKRSARVFAHPSRRAEAARDCLPFFFFLYKNYTNARVPSSLASLCACTLNARFEDATSVGFWPLVQLRLIIYTTRSCRRSRVYREFRMDCSFDYDAGNFADARKRHPPSSLVLKKKLLNKRCLTSERLERRLCCFSLT